MRKWLLTLFIVVMVVFLGLPYVMGKLAESKVKELVSVLPTFFPAEVKLDSYQRRWFTSRARLTVMPTNPELQQKFRHYITGKGLQINAPLSFSVDAQIDHGPLLFAINNKGDVHLRFGQALILATLSLGKSNQILLKNFMGQTDLLMTETTIGFNNNIYNVFISHGVAYVDQAAKIYVNWQGANGEWWLSNKFNKFKGNANLFGGSLVFDDNEWRLSKIAIELAQHRDANAAGLWIGDGNVKVPLVVYRSGGKAVFALQDFNGQTSTKAHKGLISTHALVDIKQVKVGNKVVGPAHYEASIRNLDAITLARLHQLANKVNRDVSQASQQAVSQAAMIAQQAQLKVLQARFIDLLPALLDRGAQLDVKSLSVQTPKGPVTAHAHLAFPDKRETAAQQPVTGMLSLLIGANASLGLRVPTKIAESLVGDMLQFKQQQAQRFKAQQPISGAGQQSAQHQASQLLAGVVAEHTQSTQPHGAHKSPQQSAQSQLHQWLKDGIVLHKDGDYSITLSYKDKQFLLNGVPMQQVRQMMQSNENSEPAAPATKPAPKAATQQ